MDCLVHQKKNAQPLDNKTIALNKDAIFKLPRPHNGQIAIAVDTNETYIYNDGWKLIEGKVNVSGEGLKMSLYDLNQSIIEQLPTMTDYTNSKFIINDFEYTTNNKFYMLYGKEISYFTVFVMLENGEVETLGDAVIECLSNLGNVKSIDYTENKDAIEIWVQIPDQDNLITCLYLFPYDNGIITVKE